MILLKEDHGNIFKGVIIMARVLSDRAMYKLKEYKLRLKYNGNIPKHELLKLIKVKPLEVRKKISLSHIGKKHSEETKEKIRIANTGKKHSEERKKKISDSMKIARIGVRHSAETRRKIGDAMRKKK